MHSPWHHSGRSGWRALPFLMPSTPCTTPAAESASTVKGIIHGVNESDDECFESDEGLSVNAIPRETNQIRVRLQIVVGDGGRYYMERSESLCPTPLDHIDGLLFL